MKGKKVMKKAYAFLLAAVAVLALGAWRIAPALSETQPAVAPAASGPAPAVIVAAGRVEPVSEEITIGSDLDGKLRAVPVEEGRHVRRGEVVAILDNGDFAARVESARAAVAEREAELDRLVNGTRLEERREAQAEVRRAEAILENARTERDRRQSLLDRGAISRSEFDTVNREYRVAAAAVEAARERYRFVDAAARADEVRRSEAVIARARAQLAEAEAMLAKTVIRSPIDGVVLRKYRKAGESVSATSSTPILMLGDVSRLRVRADVDETDVARLAAGQPAWVTAAAYGDRKFTGRVVRIGQILGRKNVRTDEPTERVDTKILETLIELDPGQELPLGLRVDAFLEVSGRS
jgi:HlyD family secretion protein